MPEKKSKKADFSKDDTRIFEVKPMLPKIPLPRPINPVLPQHPTTVLILATCGQGKTNFLTNLVLRKEMLGGDNPIYEQIKFISPTVLVDQSTQPFLQEELEDVVDVFDEPYQVDEVINSFVQHTRENYDITDPDRQPPRTFILVDDCSGYLRRNSNTSNLWSRHRHYNASLFCLNQCIRDLPSTVRKLSKCVFLSRCTSAMEQKAILEEWADRCGGEEQMLAMWNKATEEKFSFFYINMTDPPNPRYFKIGGTTPIQEFVIDHRPEMDGGTGAPDESYLPEDDIDVDELDEMVKQKQNQEY